jgi:hypothetical protein
MQHPNGAKSGSFLSPRAYLRDAERRAIRMRKLLRSCSGRKTGAGVSGLEDALRLVELIERFARRGQKMRAAQAVKAAEYVDRLIGLLAQQF